MGRTQGDIPGWSRRASGRRAIGAAPPLNSLEEQGLVISRTAHVIGAPRRRKVYHATDTGREEAAKSALRKTSAEEGQWDPSPTRYSCMEGGISSERCHRASPMGPAFAGGAPRDRQDDRRRINSRFPSREGWLVRWATCRLTPTLLDIRNVVRRKDTIVKGSNIR